MHYENIRLFGLSTETVVEAAALFSTILLACFADLRNL